MREAQHDGPSLQPVGGSRHPPTFMQGLVLFLVLFPPGLKLAHLSSAFSARECDLSFKDDREI